MTRPRLILLSALLGLLWAGAVRAQQEPPWEIESLTGEGGVVYDFQTGLAVATNGVLVRYADAVLTADQVAVNQQTGEAVAEGRVRIQRDDQLWTSEHIRYNFRTRQLEAEQFRTGRAPFFAAGRGLHGDLSNRVYVATNAFVTTDDVPDPALKVRAAYLRIVPGQRIEARHATLYVGGVPVFYFPYFTRSLTKGGSGFNFVPGYRSKYGPFLLGSYTWLLSDELDATLHADYRERRGFAGGPDVNLHLGRWGESSLRYYYLYDQDPKTDSPPQPVPDNRQRLAFTYQADPVTNLQVKSVVRWQSDPYIVKDFFESEYRENPQPNTYVEATKFWRNFSLDTYVQPRVNDFFETVERLPEVRLSGYRQQVGATPLYYESESSAGYYRRLFAETNGLPVVPHFEAARADTLQQVLLPHTFFGWLNVTPRAGGRFTYYGESTGPGGIYNEELRGVFNTGAEMTFKVSRLWAGTQSGWLELNGLRHILEPSLNYVYVPDPSTPPNELPPFDYQYQTLRLLPIDFPDYNSIDSIDSQNVLRLGLRNKLQTKRGGKVVNLLDWNLYTDWRLQPQPNQRDFSDLFSDLSFRPRSWLSFESLLRLDTGNGDLRLSFTTMTIQPPGSVWSWTVGHWYLVDNNEPPPIGWGQGANLVGSTFFFRLNENWAVRAAHRYDITDGRFQEQSYSLYRDFRSWTGALSFRWRDNPVGQEDFTVAFTFSLKAFPRYPVGLDAVRPLMLLGS